MPTEFTNEFSKSQWISKYRFEGEETVDDTFKIVAQAIAEPEKDKTYWVEQFRNLLDDFHFIPGGRILSNAGRGLKGTTLLNCFSGDTEIITRNGIRTLKSLENTNFKTLNKNGKWADATVLNFGKQQLYKLTVKKNRDVKVIYTTGNHRWFANTQTISKYVELTTVELRTCHRLKQSTSRILKSTIPSYHWKVISVEETNRHEDVYCAVVPDSHTFTLEGNILTGNCFVEGFTGTDQDSVEGIYNALYRQAKTLQSEGGYGFCADVMRPRGSNIGGIGNQSPGAVKFLELWDKSSEIITSGSGKKANKGEKEFIRKGAQMVTMSVWNPDILEFITAKSVEGRLSKFNMSVLISDDFMKAVEDDADWNLEYPNYKQFSKLYKDEWDGNLVKWKNLLGEPTDNILGEGTPSTIIYKTMKAREIWNLITERTYIRNEPGVLFIDTMNRMNNLWYTEFIHSTNPCIAKGTLILTNVGYKKVEDICPEHALISTVLGFEEINKVEKHENLPVFKVKFSDGGEQIVTAAHRYHTLRKGTTTKKVEKLRLDEINIGDKVQVFPTTIAHADSENGMGEYFNGLTAGILLGDGCYTQTQLDKGYIKIASSKDDIEYNKLVKETFGKDNFCQDNCDPNSKSMNMVMKKEAVNLDYIGLKPGKSYEKTIDYSVINNADFAIGLLDGLLATDGNVNLTSNHPQLRWFTTSPKLAQTIRNTLLLIGCHGFITTSNDNGGAINGREILRKHPKYTISISGESVRSYSRKTSIGVIHPEKMKLITKALTEFKLSGNTWSASIVSIEPFGTSDVYDFYCKDSDTWITSGYVQQGCGEQILPKHGVCLLGSLNLAKFVKDGKWDFDKLKQYITLAVRFLDNVNDVTNVPLKEQKDTLLSKRRIGLGIVGYASALMLMKIPYGSKRALEITEELMKFKVNTEYQASALLAKEKGSFPEYEQDKYLQGKFIQSALDEETIALIKKYGMRNSHVSSIQPTGNSSVFANLISSGCEPIFDFGYYRTYIVDHPPAGLIVPEVDWTKKLIIFHGPANTLPYEWKFIKEGDEDILLTEFQGSVYKIDRNRGLTKEEWVEDYAITQLKSLNEWDEKADWAKVAMNLDVDAHINTLSVLAKYIDSAISKTLNFNNDYPYEDFKEVYLKAWKNGIKGVTTYREGTMTAVLSSKSTKVGIQKVDAPKRPIQLDCDVHHIKVKGQDYFVLVGLLDGEPYEIFAGKNGVVDKKIKVGKIIKRGRGKYKAEFEDDSELSPITAFTTDEEDTITRLISAGLRHGTKVEFIVHQLEKSKGDMQTFAKSIVRALKKYIVDGTEVKGEECAECKGRLIREDGCCKCRDCGFSKC